MGTMGILHVQCKLGLSWKGRRGGGFSAMWTKVAGNCTKWIYPVSEFFSLFDWGAFLPGPQWNVQWCMKYVSAKLCHITRCGSAKLHHITWCSLAKLCHVTRCGSPKLRQVTDGNRVSHLKARGGCFSADLHQVEVLPVGYSSLSYYITKD